MEEGGLQRPDHMQMLLSASRKHPVSSRWGGKGAMHTAWVPAGRHRDVVCRSSDARGYRVSPVGMNGASVHCYNPQHSTGGKHFDRWRSLGFEQFTNLQCPRG